MKKLVMGSLIVFVLLFFVLNFSSDAQIVRDTRLSKPVLDGMFTIKQGWVLFLNNKNIQQKSYIMSEITVNLKRNNYYKLYSVKLNGKESISHNAYGERFLLDIVPFNCQVGQTFELIAKLVRKDAPRTIRQIPVIVKLATYRVQNLIKEFSFPAAGQEVSINPVPDPLLTFKWKFFGNSQKTMLRVRRVPGNEVSRTEQMVTYRKIRKTNFEFDKEYKIRLGAYWGPNHKFTFTRYVAPNSKLEFSDEFYSKFKTKKKLISRLLQKKL